MDSQETWKPFPLDQEFQVSSLGRIKGVRGKVRVGHLCADGYHRITLRGSRKQTHTVHSMVAATFLGERPRGWVVCHKDGNKSNNAAENLMYATPAFNERHKRRHGINVCPLLRTLNGKQEIMQRTNVGGKARGQSHGRSSTTDVVAAQIVEALRFGEIQAHIAKRLGVSRRIVSQIATRRSWRHLTEGVL